MSAQTFTDILKYNPYPQEEEPTNENTFSICKSDDDKRLIFGWASVAIRTDGNQVIDFQKDLIDPSDLEEAVYTYVLDFRDSGEEHIPSMRKKGRLVESVVFTKEKMSAMGIPEGLVPEGWWIGFYIDDDDAWEKVKNGTYQMFSIEGQGIRKEVDEPLTKSAYDEWLEEHLDDFKDDKDERDFAQWKSEHGKPIKATDVDVVDMLYNEYRKIGKTMSPEKRQTVAKTFDEILKFNPFHDALGRFASSKGFKTYSANPKSKAGAMAIGRSAAAGHGKTMNVHRESKGENIAQNDHWLKTGQKPAVPAAQMPKKNFDKRGFADYDDADFHQLGNRKAYYLKQNLTPAEQHASKLYMQATPQPGSLYSLSQNMNYKMSTGQKLSPQEQQVHDDLMGAMHNLGVNSKLTRYDHDTFLNDMLNAVGAGNDYMKLTDAQLQKALLGKNIQEDKFLSTSTNDFANAPGSSRSTFTTRPVKIIYKAKADVQGMMPGNGPGGDLGEVVLAPTNGKNNRGGTIVDIKFNGQRARRKGTQNFSLNQVEITIEI